ncbi:hypothetical protein AB0O01_16155 [Streptomyces sp. NPDC093252]|uniref:hypothetical protein n=1 Tax=Streptomyces sp. NPDC093252 TaxID=3154980 RepID=UPI00341E30BD
MNQPSAVHHAEVAGPVPAVPAGTGLWESDLADLTGLSLSAVDALPPLGAQARVLQEVLRARHGVQKGGNEGPSGRAE